MTNGSSIAELAARSASRMPALASRLSTPSRLFPRRPHWSRAVMRSMRTAPLPLLGVSLLLLGLAGGLLAFMVYPAYAQSGDPPDRPTGLNASVVSGVGVNLTWNNPADDTITGYEIRRRELGVDESGDLRTIEENTGSADTSYTDATVKAGSNYCVPGDSHQRPRQERLVQKCPRRRARGLRAAAAGPRPGQRPAGQTNGPGGQRRVGRRRKPLLGRSR